MSRISKVINASKLGDVGLRLIGTTDIDGNGTPHEVDQVDPIVLFDFVEMKPSAESSFRPHPHFGLTAMSFLPEKGTWMAWDSLDGDTEEHLRPGGLYYVHAGAPAFHHEFAAPETIEARETVEFVQLVWNATDEQDVRTVIIPPEDIPVVTTEDHIIRVMAGELCGVKSVQPFSHRKIVYAYVRSLGSSTLDLDLPHDMNGIVFPVEGSLKANGLTVEQHQMMVLGQGDGALSISRASPEQNTRFIVAAGEPVDRPFHKLLGLGGFILGDTEQGVRAMMESLGDRAEEIKREVPHYFPAQYR